MIGAQHLGKEAKTEKERSDYRLALETAVIQKHGWIEAINYHTNAELETLLSEPSRRGPM